MRAKSPVLITHEPTNWMGSLSERPICVTILTKVTVVYHNSLYKEWLGWIYVNLDPLARPLAPRLAPLAELLQNYDLESFHTLFRVDEIWNTNWKILFQNFMEPYHLFAVHNKTVEPVLPTQNAHVVTGGPGYCLYTQRRNPGVAFEYHKAMANPNSKLTEVEVNSVPLFGAFPAHMASVSAERTFWMSLMPITT